jgi:hypothetical protein
MRTSRTALGALLAVLPILFGAGAATAQIEWSARLPAEYRSWTLETSGGQKLEVSQIYVPLVGTLAIRPSTRFVISAAGAHSKLENRAGNESLSGLADVKLQIYQNLVHDRLVVLGGVNLPTGKRELSQDELEVMQALAHPLLGMRLKQYGRGLDLNAGAAVSVPIRSGLELGAGVGYLHSGKYTLSEGGEEYEPTPEASASFALEIASPRREHTVQLRVTGRSYQEDRLDGRRIFEEGDQLEATLRGTARAGRVRASLMTQGAWKKDDRAFGSPDPVGRVSTTTPGTGIVAHLAALYAVTEMFDAGVAGDWKRFQSSDVAQYNGDAFGVGPAVGIRIGSSGLARLEGLISTGTAGEGSGELDLSGFTVSASLLWRP